MQNIKKITTTGVLLMALIFTMNAQDKSRRKKKDDGEIKVIMIDSENGETNKTEETFSLKDKEKVQKLLKEKGIEFSFDEAAGMKFSIEDNGDVDKTVIINTTDEKGNTFITSEQVKIVTGDDGKSVTAGDVEVMVKELEGLEGKHISIFSTKSTDSEHEVIVEGDEEELREGKTMIFVRKNSKVTSTNLPSTLQQSFRDESALKDLNLYPNPTNGNFNMSFVAEEKGDFDLNITDSKGAVVFEKMLKNFKGKFQEDFDLSKYEAGVYFFNLFLGKEKISRKIVVQ